MDLPLSSLTALSPVDGRYGEKSAILRPIFSEFALLKYRLLVEIRWLEQLAASPEVAEVPFLNVDSRTFFATLIANFNQSDAQRIKEIEKSTRHDLKAVEYFLREKLASRPDLQHIAEFCHFACTSEDINNLAYALMVKAAKEEALLPHWNSLIDTLKNMAQQHSALPMLSRTHGQPATPTTLGKELANVAYRLMRQIKQLQQVPLMGKFNGAVGNYNAHLVAYPEIDWPHMSQNFVESLGLCWNPYTTQIEPHDWLSELLHTIIRFNTILLDFSRDMWGYISLNYFQQQLEESEVGSSTMPHKINPIDFENSEGNLGVANALLGHLALKLPISRWQRDLSDSTTLRNLGVAMGYSLVAYHSLSQGLARLEVNERQLASELDREWAVLAEAIQTVMRRHRLPLPYEQLKKITRGQRVNRQTLEKLLDQLPLPPAERARLKELTPARYTGLAEKLARQIVQSLPSK